MCAAVETRPGGARHTERNLPVEHGSDAAAAFRRGERGCSPSPRRTPPPRIAERSVDTVPACNWSGIFLRRRRGRLRRSRRSPLADRIDLAGRAERGPRPGRHRTNEAPARRRPPHRRPLARVGRARTGAGIGSSLSVPLSSESHALGALNLYAAKPFAFDADSRARPDLRHRATIAGRDRPTRQRAANRRTEPARHRGGPGHHHAALRDDPGCLLRGAPALFQSRQPIARESPSSSWSRGYCPPTTSTSTGPPRPRTATSGR